MNRTPAIISLIIILLIIVSGLIYWAMVRQHAGPSFRPQPPSPSLVTPPGSGISQAPPSHAARGMIYVAGQGGQGTDENDLQARTISFADPKNPARSALDALISAEHSPLPRGTALRGIKIEDGLATVDFSREFKSNFHGSDTAELQAVNSILRTLGQFPEISRVQILVDGKTIESLGDMVIISGPLDVIRPATVRQAKAAGGANSE